MKLFSISTAAREADVSVDTLRSYTNQGLIECERLENGTRIFNEASIAKARELKTANMARLRSRVV